LGHRPALDGLRGIAIALVLAYHSWGSAFPGGNIGVDLFFVLSGFLITVLLLEEHGDHGRIDLRAFYARRARRLLPALLVMLLAVATVLLAQHKLHDVAQLGYVVTYTSNYAWEAHQLPTPVVHTWSLAIEAQFYVVWPLVLIALLRLRARAIAVVAVGAMVLGVLAYRLAGNGPTQSDLPTPVRADALLVGCLMAFVFVWFGAATFRWWMPALFATPVLVADVLGGRDLRGYGLTVVAVLFATVLGAALTCEPVGHALARRPLVYLGRISYSLYLWQVPIVVVVNTVPWLHGLPFALRVALVVVSSVAVAAVSYEFVERRWIRRRKPVAPSTETARW
jgi:peptidoglycan/LPS O-acetylase OafA/YrhL